MGALYYQNGGQIIVLRRRVRVDGTTGIDLVSSEEEAEEAKDKDSQHSDATICWEDSDKESEADGDVMERLRKAAAVELTYLSGFAIMHFYEALPPKTPHLPWNLPCSLSACAPLRSTITNKTSVRSRATIFSPKAGPRGFCVWRVVARGSGAVNFPTRKPP
jgi:hypothetical protein